MNTRTVGSSNRLIRRFLIFVGIAFAVGSSWAQVAPVETLVQDTLYRADGKVAHGTLTIRWNSFTSSGGEAVAAGEMTVKTDANGGVAIPLIANTGSSPSGTYYRVFMKLDDGTTSEELWVVPAVTTTTIAAIRAKVAPQAVAAQFVSRDYVDTALAAVDATLATVAPATLVHLAGAETLVGAKTFTVSPQVPAPASAGSAVDKAYVDQGFAGLATVAATGNYNDLLNKPPSANLGAPGAIGLVTPGTVNATAYSVNGTPLASANLSDAGSLVRTSQANTFLQPQTVTFTGSDTAAAALLVNASSSSISTNPVVKVALPPNGGQRAMQAINGSDSNAWYSLEYNEGGTGLPGIGLGPGGSAARDTFLYRSGANALATTGSFTADVSRHNAGWFDVRTDGVTCNGSSNDTAAFATAIASFGNSSIELPPGTCMVAPVNGTTPMLAVPHAGQFFKMVGRSGDHGTRIQDSTSTTQSNPPMLKIGDGSAIVAGTDLQDFSLVGATNVSYPSGILSFEDDNLSSVTRVEVGMPTGGTNSIGMTNILTADSNAIFGEMRFKDFSSYCNGTNSTGVLLNAPGSNTDFVSSNIENCVTAMKFLGSDGSPHLNWTGGHIERTASGGFAFFIDQAQPFIYGADAGAGTIYLGSSVVGGDISVSAPSAGWASIYVDNGIGNKFRRVSSAAMQNQALELDGGEWYRVPGNVVSDPLFLINGKTGWTATNATVAIDNIKAPGAKAGQSLLVTSTTAGGYISQSFSVAASTDYLFSAVFYFNKTSTAAQVQVYDQASNLVWDSGSFGPSQATPTMSDSWAYRVMRQWLPNTGGSVTSYTVRIIAPSTSAPVVVSALMIHPSLATMTGAVPTYAGGGSAACSGTGTAYACSLSGRNGGPATASVQWNIPGQPYGSFLRMHVATDANAVSPICVLNGTNNNTAGVSVLYFPATTNSTTSLDYTIPLGASPTIVNCFDYSGPVTDTSEFVISQVSVVPIYPQTVVPVTTYTAGNFVEYVDPAGVQHMGSNSATATTAANVSGVVAVANGGTGATSASAALTALGADAAGAAATAQSTAESFATSSITSAVGTETTRAETAEGLLVPKTTTVNGHALSSNVTVSASDLTTGTLPHAQLPALLSADIPANAANTSGNAATATNLAAAVALPNGTTATTQAYADNSTKLATDAFVLANGGGCLLFSGCVEQVQINSSTPTFGGLGDAWIIATSATASLSALGSTQPQMIQATSAATSGDSAGWSGYSSMPIYYAARQPLVQFGVGYSASTDYSSNARIWLGLVGNSCTTTTMAASDNPACSYAAIRYSTTASDTYYECVTGTGSAQTVTSIGVAPSTTFTPMSINIGASSVTCNVGGTSVSNTTNLPASTTLMFDLFYNTTLTAAATHLRMNGAVGRSQNGTY
jgi:hypothetical protein